MKHKFHLITKLRAIEMADETGNKRKTARKFRIDPAQIKIWLKAANWRREQYNLLESGKNYLVRNGKMCLIDSRKFGICFPWKFSKIRGWGVDITSKTE